MLVSCVCPITGERASSLPGVISCFTSQTYANKELLIVVDGPKAADIPPTNTDNIRTLYLPGPQRILGAKRNTMNALARGELIAHFDSDDWSASTRLEEQVAFLNSTGKQAVGYPDILFFREMDKAVIRYTFLGGAMPYAVGTTLCYRTDWWRTHQFAERSVGEDTAFAFQTQAANELVCCPNNGRVVARILADTTGKADHTKQEFQPGTWDELPEGFRKIVLDKGLG